jgi:hypothetical protein
LQRRCSIGKGAVIVSNAAPGVFASWTQPGQLPGVIVNIMVGVCWRHLPMDWLTMRSGSGYCLNFVIYQ